MRRSMLDTDTLSFYLKGVPGVVGRARQYVEQFGCLEFTIITYYGIRRGLLHGGTQRKAEQFEKLAAASRIRPPDLARGRQAADICVRLWHKGTPPG